MSVKIPYGKPESSQLEIKRAEALKDPNALAREVVGFLNARGGDIWIGAIEEDERFVRAEGVPDDAREKRRLEDILISRIEPAPVAGEVEVSVVDAGGGRSLLRVHCKPKPGRKPYASLEKGGRYFGTRVGARLRPLSHAEISRFFRETEVASPSPSSKRMAQARKRFEERKEGGLWLHVEPEPELEIDINSPELRRLLGDPTATGNRRMGFVFTSYHTEPKFSAREGTLLLTPDDGRRLEIHKSGGIDFTAPAAFLRWGTPPGQPSRLHPLALIELPASVLRLAAKIYPDPKDDDSAVVLIDFALAGIGGWQLSPHVAVPEDFTWAAPKTFPEREGYERPQPLRIKLDDLVANPDRAGFILIRDVYEEFGFDEDAVPPCYDRKSERLLLPT